MVDALAPAGEEGRGRLRKASGRSEHLLIRRYPNGATHLVGDQKSERKRYPGK